MDVESQCLSLGQLRHQMFHDSQNLQGNKKIQRIPFKSLEDCTSTIVQKKKKKESNINI